MLRIGRHTQLIVMGVEPCIDTRSAFPETVSGQAGALQRLPRHLQEQPLLRIEAACLSRRDLEEIGVEAGNVVDERRLPRQPAPSIGDIPLGIPTLCRCRPCGTPVLHEQLPERLGGIGTVGETTPHSHHRDGVVRPAGIGHWR